VIDALDDKDFATNVMCRTFATGLDVEVMPFKTLWGLNQILSPDHPDRAHVCSYIYKVPKMFDISEVEHEQDNSQLRWCVDYEEDLEEVEKVLRLGVLPYGEVLRRLNGEATDDVSWAGSAAGCAGEIGPDDGTDEGIPASDELD